MPSSSKPLFVVAPSGKPTIETLIEMFTRLTGRTPTPEDIEQAKQTLARVKEK